MPEYLSPGVYVEEVDTGSKPIEGVGTAMAAFMGYAPAGQFQQPELITNWSQFCEKFGGAAGDPYLRDSNKNLLSYLAPAVYGYFNNGGTRCYVVRVPRDADLKQANGSVKALPAQAATGRLSGISFRAVEAGSEGNTITVAIEPDGEAPLTERFRLVVTKGDQREEHTQAGTGRSAQPLNLSNVQTAVKSKLIEITEVAADAQVEAAVVPLQGGAEPVVPPKKAESQLEADDFEGNERKRTGMGGYAALDDVTMLCVPDLMAGLYQRAPLVPKLVRGRGGPDTRVRLCPKCKQPLEEREDEETGKRIVQEYANEAAAEAAPPVTECPKCKARGEEFVDADALEARKDKLKGWQTGMLDHCANMHDRVAILDSPPGMNPMEIRHYRNDYANFDSKYGALYYPWIQVMDPLTKAPTYVPPCGHMAGIWARNDSERGVHKAPANEVVRGAIDLEYNVSKGEQDILNPNGINCIRDFPGRGRRVWGARTLSSDPSWRYLNIRRFFNYLEKSIERGTQWVVFEPNDYDLWQRVRRNISAFLRLHWQEGMLFGRTPEEAFFVKCDDETNPQESIELGRLVTEIGVRPVYPAEFVVFRIGQWSGGSSTAE